MQIVRLMHSECSALRSSYEATAPNKHVTTRQLTYTGRKHFTCLRDAFPGPSLTPLKQLRAACCSSVSMPSAQG